MTDPKHPNSAGPETEKAETQKTAADEAWWRQLQESADRLDRENEKRRMTPEEEAAWREDIRQAEEAQLRFERENRGLVIPKTPAEEKAWTERMRAIEEARERRLQEEARDPSTSTSRKR